MLWPAFGILTPATRKLSHSCLETSLVQGLGFGFVVFRVEGGFRVQGFRPYGQPMAILVYVVFDVFPWLCGLALKGFRLFEGRWF